MIADHNTDRGGYVAVIALPMARISGFNRCALARAVVALLLAGCGVLPLSPAKVSPSNGQPQISALAAQRDHGHSWMLPEARGDNLLYVSDGVSGNVFIFSYPQAKEVGEITGFNVPEGACVDNAQNVFIVVQDSGIIYKFRHGGTKPIASIRDRGGSSPLGCSVSSATGDLAVVNGVGAPISSSSYGPPNVAVYTVARGKPKIYSDPNLSELYFCSYDDAGNLFIDGTDYSNNTVLIELPKRSKTFRNIAVQPTIKDPGGVGWDGRHVVVADRKGPSGYAVVYRFTIKGDKGIEVGSTVLGGDVYVISFWIQNRTLIGGDPGAGAVRFWKYPEGGTATTTISGFRDPAAMTISLASK
jgi:hypothetical protein